MSFFLFTLILTSKAEALACLSFGRSLSQLLRLHISCRKFISILREKVLLSVLHRQLLQMDGVKNMKSLQFADPYFSGPYIIF